MPKKYYRMTDTQKMLFHSQDFTKLKQLNNLSTLCTVENADPAILARAAEKAVADCDALRLCYDIIDISLPDYEGYLQYFSDAKPEPVKILDFSDKTENEMRKVLRSAENRNLCKPDSRMYRLMVLITPEKKTAIFLAVSNTIMDRWAMNVFLDYVFRIYEAEVNGTEPPKKPCSYEEYLQKELETESVKSEKDARYWYDVYANSSEPVFTHPDGRTILEKFRKKKSMPDIRYVDHLAHGGKSRTDVFVIPKELVERTVRFAEKEHLSVQAVLSCALMLRIAAVNSENDVSIRTIVARRSTKEEKHTFGCRILYQQLRMIFDPGLTFREECLECWLRLCAVYRHPNAGNFALKNIFSRLFYTDELGTYNTVSVTFLPLSLRFMGKPVATEWLPSGSISHLMHIYVTDDDGSGGLRVYIETLADGVKPDSAKNLFSALISLLDKVLDKPELTVREIFR